MLRQVSDRQSKTIVTSSRGGHAAVLCTHRKGMIIYSDVKFPMLGSTRDAAGCALKSQREAGEGGRSRRKTGCRVGDVMSQNASWCHGRIASHLELLSNQHFCLSLPMHCARMRMGLLFLFQSILDSQFVTWNLKGSSGRRAVQSQMNTFSGRDREKARAPRYYKLMPEIETFP